MFNDLKDAVRGSAHDYTTGSLGRAVFLLSVPMVLEMVLESVFAVVDIYYVSRLGPDAIAAVGYTEAMITIIYAISVGFSIATGAMVSRRIGEKRPEQAAEVAFQAILTGVLVSVLIAIPSSFFAADLLKFIGASETICASMSSYTAIMLGGNVVIMLLFIINAVFRSAGDAAISMRVLWLANILNLVLDPILIFGLGPFPELGITGAAVATNTGRGLAVLYQFYLLFSSKGKITLRRQHVAIHPQTIKQLITLSLGSIGQHLIATSSWIVLTKIMSKFGTPVVAGYTIAIRVILFVLLPIWGMSNAAATLVGQNLGAQRPDRAEKSVWITGLVCAGIMGLTSLAFILFPAFFIGLLAGDPEVIRNGTGALKILSYGFVFFGGGSVLVQALNGSGDTRTPTWINLICFWIFELPLAYVTAILFGIGETAVFYSILCSQVMMTTMAYYYFRLGRWKLTEV